MASFDEDLTQATAAGPERKIPGCVLTVVKDGKTVSKSFGTQSVDPNSRLVKEAINPDTTMWIASCTKLMTAISVLQCVEKGLLDLSDDVSAVLDEWKERHILTGFEDGSGKPILKPTTTKVTLRELLTHSSGMGYEFMNPALERYVQYQQSIGKMESDSLLTRYHLPLLFEPGSSWEYGVGIDWAGQMVERVTKQSLGAYMQEHIWEPLGMKSSTFRLQERTDVRDRRADMSKRDEHGAIVPSETRYFTDHAEDDYGGGGVFSSPADYTKVLAALLDKDNALLKPDSIDLLFKPCLAAEARKGLQENRLDKDDDSFDMATGATSSVDYALGGMVTLEDSPGGRKRGSLSWGGLPNLSWIVDRESGFAFLYASQLLPPGDAITKQLVKKFEAAIYSGEFFQKH